MNFGVWFKTYRRSLFKLFIMVIFVGGGFAQFFHKHIQTVSKNPWSSFQTQIAKCWTPLSGSNQPKVDIKLEVNPDRTIQVAEVVDKARYDKDQSFKTSADMAIHALNDPACHQLDLPLDKYEEWKEIFLTFDPKDVP